MSMFVSGSITSTGSLGILELVSSDGMAKLDFTRGTNNVSIGFGGTGQNLTTGAVGNIFVGFTVGSQITTGDQNVGVGYQNLTGGNSTGNTAVGYRALKGVTTGIGNVGIGRNAVDALQSGNFNIGIGQGADLGSTSAANRIVIGHDAAATADNQTVIGNTSQTHVVFNGDSLISGSAKSTGSFGKIQVPQSHYINFLSGGAGTTEKWRIFNSGANILEIASVAYGGSPITIDATGGGVNVAANLDVGAGVDVSGVSTFAAPATDAVSITVGGAIESSAGLSTHGASVTIVNKRNEADQHGLVVGAKNSSSYPLIVGRHDSTFSDLVVNGSGKVGIGTTVPDGKLHVFNGSAGTVTANSENDDLIIESSGNTGMTLIGPDANDMGIGWGSVSLNRAVLAKWNYAANSFRMRTNRASAIMVLGGGESLSTLTLDASNNATFLGNVSGSSTSTGSFGIAKARKFQVNYLSSGGTISNAIAPYSAYINDATSHTTHTGADNAPFNGLSIENINTTNDAHASVGFRVASYDAGISAVYGGSTNVGKLAFTMGGNEPLVINTSNQISGSATSTGSFAQGFIADKLGIGTSSPSTMLHLKSSTSTKPKLTIEDTNADDNMGALQFIKDSASPGTGDKLMQIWAYGDNNAAEQILYSEIATLPTSVADGSEEGSMRFRVMSGGSFVETMRVRGNKVGIGVTDPDALLEVAGTTHFQGNSTFDGLVSITDTTSNSTGILTITGNNAPAIKFNTAQDDWLIGTHYAGSGHDFSIINTTLSKIPLVIVNDTVGIGGHGSSNGTDPTGLGLIIDGTDATFSTNVGIGITSPDNTLHVHKGTAGSVTGNQSTTPLIVENNNHNFIQFLAPTDKSSGLYFGSPTGNLYRGEMGYDNTNDIFKFYAGENKMLELAANKISGSIHSTGSFGKGVFTAPAGHPVVRLQRTAQDQALQITMDNSNDLNGARFDYMDGSTAYTSFYATLNGIHIGADFDGNDLGNNALDLGKGESATIGFADDVTLQNSSLAVSASIGIGTTSVPASGLYVAKGNISGSATSTGSFGNVYVGKGGAQFGNTKFAVVDNNSTEYAPMGGSSNTANAMVQFTNTNSSATAPHSLIHFRLDKSGGDGYMGFMTSTSTGNVEHFVVGNQVDGELIRGASGGNVGIGDSNPSGKLVVSGSGTINLHIDNSGTGDTGLLGKRNATSIFGMFDDASDSKLRIVNYQAEPIEFSVDRGGSETIVMTMLNSGNVGIGTTNPAENLNLASAEPVMRFTDTDNSNYHHIFGSSNLFYISADRNNTGTGALIFRVGGTDERMRINSSGKVSIGHSSTTQDLEVFNTTSDSEAKLTVTAQSSGGNTSTLRLRANRNDTKGSNTIVTNGQFVGQILFQGADGSDYANAARIYATVDGAPGGNDMPGAINFGTSADGSEGLTHRMIIDSSGNVGVGDSNPAQTLVVSGSSKGLLSVGLTGGGSRVTIGDTSMDSALHMRRSSNGAANVQVLQLGSSLYVGATSNVINTIIQSNTSVLTVGSSKVTSNASFEPTSDASFNLGAADKRWSNIFSADLQLSNEGTEGNEVDGTTGSWTIQEGEDDLYLLNRKNGKKYKFKLEEIT